MSVFYGVRLPDELSAKVEATGQGKTEVIVTALEAYFGGQAEPEKPEKMIIAKPEKKPRAKASESAKPIEREPESAKVPAVSGGCTKHPGGGGWPKGGGWWCLTCGAVV